MTPQEVVSHECQLIPDHTPDQRVLRMAFVSIRKGGLARKPKPETPRTRKGAIDEAVQIIRSSTPDFIPRYDARLNTEEPV